MKKYSRVLAGILAVLLSAGCTGLYAAAQSDSSSAADSAASTTKSESDKKNTKDTKKADKSDSDTEKQAKEETVYVITDASGNKTKTVVSNWLKNPQGVKKLEDVSDLKDIENVKTDEGFTANGDKLTWDTEGGDIYYKGYTDKALPVDVKVTYTLDGKEIKPEDLAGKSGKLTVRYDYTNNDKKTVKINGKKTDIYVPYLMATTAILDTNVYSNVEVTNGKLISDGSRQILIGVAMPGLTKSLDLQDNEDIEIPEYVEFTADVKDFESTTSLTVATSDIFSKLDLSDIGDADDLQDKLDELSDATDELVDGTAELYAGIKKLSDSSGTLITGIDKLYSGSKSLDDGAKTLNSGATKLRDGAKTLDSSTGELMRGISTAHSGSTALLGGFDQVNSGMSTLKNGSSSLSSGLSQVSSGAQQVNNGAASLAAGTNKLVTGVGDLQVLKQEQKHRTDHSEGGIFMTKVKIMLDSIAAVKKFVSVVSMYDFDVDLASGRYAVDAKSIMGIFSLDLSNPIQLVAHTDDATKFLDEIKEFIVD